MKEFTNDFVKDKWEEIEKGLKEVKGKLLKPAEEDDNNKQELTGIVKTHRKEIIEKFIEEFNAILDANDDNENQSNQGSPTD